MSCVHPPSLTTFPLLSLLSSLSRCRYAKFSGGKLTMVTLGGSAFTWEDQCNLNAYKSIKNFETQAYCEPVGSGNRVRGAAMPEGSLPEASYLIDQS